MHFSAIQSLKYDTSFMDQLPLLRSKIYYLHFLLQMATPVLKKRKEKIKIDISPRIFLQKNLSA